MMTRRIIISVTSDIVTDQRVLKVADYLHGKGHDITVVGRVLPGSLSTDGIPYRVKRFRMIFSRGMLFYKFFNIRLFFFLVFHKQDLLIANDLDTLLPNYIIARIFSKQLVFDAHEYFTGVPELQDRGFSYKVWKFLERRMVPGISHMITVNESIARLYHDEYGVDPLVVRNIGRPYNGPRKRRSELGIGEDELLVVLQGTGINHGRGGLELIKAIAETEGASLVVIGRGESLNEMKQLALELNMQGRIQFLQSMQWEEMMSYTSMCDVGVSLDSGLHLNYINSLPNKIFDYMNAGLAIIATDLPEIAKIISESDCGILIDNALPATVSEALRKLIDDRELLGRIKENSIKASRDYSWLNEIKKIDQFPCFQDMKEVDPPAGGVRSIIKNQKKR